MKTLVYLKQTRFNFPASEVFQWHCRDGAFERLTPPWQAAHIIDTVGGIEDNGSIVIKTKVGPIWIKWELKHEGFVPGSQFRDILTKGPFKYWNHLHEVIPDGQDSSILEDQIEFAMHFGVLGNVFGAKKVKTMLANMFSYRHRVLQNDLADHQEYSGTSSLKILISGSSGLIGSSLASYLNTGGHQVSRLVRSRKGMKPRDIFWDPHKGIINVSSLEGFDFVIHLAGENVANGRWNSNTKDKILQSRVLGTKLLSDTLAKLKTPPKALLCASASGYYGNSGDTLVNETNSLGNGFLPMVVQQWEQATKDASDAGIRVINMRLGVVLNPRGGALKKMLTPFKLCMGGKIGTGQQYISWIALDDVIGAIHHIMLGCDIQGPVNIAAPNPITNAEFAKHLARSLRRISVLPVPAFMIKLLFGDMGKETVLTSTRMDSTKLMASGYRYKFDNLGPALDHMLGIQSRHEL